MTYAIVISVFAFGTVFIATFDLVSECWIEVRILSARTISHSLLASRFFTLEGTYKEQGSLSLTILCIGLVHTYNVRRTSR